MAIGIPAYHNEKRKHQLDKKTCEELTSKVLQELPWIEIGYLKDAFDYRTQGTMLTFAERVLVYIGETEILVKSACLFPGQFLDFGKNKRNVDEFFRLFDKEKDAL